MGKPAPVDELNDADYLRDLSARLMDIPVMYGTDGYDVDRLSQIANSIGSKTDGH